MQDFLNDYFQKNVAEIRKTKKVLLMPDDASPDSSLAAPWIIKNFHGIHGIDSVCFARHCEEHLNRIIRCNLPQEISLNFTILMLIKSVCHQIPPFFDHVP
jgi:hypothetical protein